TSIIILIFSALIFAQQPIAEKEPAYVSAEKIARHLAFLSSDAMKGRNTPSPELDSAAVYIAGEFAGYGLKPAGDNGTYFQKFFVLHSRLGQPNAFAIITDSSETAFDIKQDFVPLHFSANRQIVAPVVFAGYGITAAKYNYDDYNGIDVRGKIVLIFTHEPQEKNANSVFDGEKLTDFSKPVNKAISAREHGAAGMIVVTDPNHRFRRPPNPWPSLMRISPKGGIPLTLEERMENKIVAVRTGKNLAEFLLDGTGKTMAELQTLIDTGLQPHSFEIPGKKIKMETHLNYDRKPTQNVVGLLEGSDPLLKEEVIIIGAHYDHLGTRNDTIIYNGADDNASGTVGILTVAETLAENNLHPRRSILFCAWAGEEKGLFGSRYYVDSAPVFPLENTVANMNLDMIGRNDSGKVELEGLYSSAELAEIINQENEGVGLKIVAKKSSAGRSDHASFLRKGVPAVEFFTGFHPDYHQPTDTAEKCFPEGIAQICRLVAKVSLRLAIDKKRPAFTQRKEN
ncbi:MAG TPA: M20/M25/M40 family metallo-hydrolase, partial [Bacteroidetes bacterium]|nr:M20/M25/M40 family metallo-hydrolase [Bacteroidota bacterium]